MKSRKDELEQQAKQYRERLRHRLGRPGLKLVAWNKRRFLIEVKTEATRSALRAQVAVRRPIADLTALLRATAAFHVRVRFPARRPISFACPATLRSRTARRRWSATAPSRADRWPLRSKTSRVRWRTWRRSKGRVAPRQQQRKEGADADAQLCISSEQSPCVSAHLDALTRLINCLPC